MKCVAINGVKSLEVKEIAEPVSSEGRVVIEVKKAGICGSDIHNWDAGAPEGLVMGHEFAGVVLDPGSRADLKAGDRVTALPISPCGECEACKSENHQYCAQTWAHALGLTLDNPGSMAEKTSFRPDMVRKLPDSVSDEEGAMVEPTAVSLHAVNLANIKEGAKVLVIGGGVIGLGCAMLAKKAGASLVCVSETNENRGKRAVELGVADKYLDAKDPEFVVKAMTESMGGFDAVLECVGIAPAVNSAIFTVKNGGSIVLVGVSQKPEEIFSVMVVMKELKVFGAIAYTIEEFEDTIRMIAEKEIDVMKFVTDTVSLEDTQKAFERLTSGSGTDIKILIDPAK
ncbi:MAG: alcohol dehydrogenase catalytic domain-containing protein [Oscillospiraceae bacterium]|nr:alcohol dehydrogenase catalytic domain-containing protein [Oscillospiraceae bacterium]